MTIPSRDIPWAGTAICTPAVIAHRGAAHDAPENTIAAFTLATVAALAFDAWRLCRKGLGKPLNLTVGETP